MDDIDTLARAPLDRDAPLAVLFTSGSTGAGRRVEKAVRHLEDEVAVLEQQFGAQLARDTRFLATVAPQHLYGLLFRVLWPLAAGRPFLRSALLHTVVGLAIGVPVAFYGVTLVKSQLYEMTTVSGGALLAAVGWKPRS